jgi:hypothetical protein
MANFERAKAFITFKDGANRTSTVEWNVPLATARAYWAAANKGARDATAIGLLFAAAALCSLLVVERTGVYLEDQESPITLPAKTALRGNKIVTGFLSNAKNYTFTLPGRDPTKYTPSSGITIDFEAEGDYADFLALFQSTCISDNGGPVTVMEAYVND